MIKPKAKGTAKVGAGAKGTATRKVVKMYTAKGGATKSHNYLVGSNEAMSYRAASPQAAGRSANAATAQAKARGRLTMKAEEKLSALRGSEGAAIGKESRDGIRGRVGESAKGIRAANQNYTLSKRKGKLAIKKKQ